VGYIARKGYPGLQALVGSLGGRRRRCALPWADAQLACLGARTVDMAIWSMRGRGGPDRGRFAEQRAAIVVAAGVVRAKEGCQCASGAGLAERALGGGFLRDRFSGPGPAPGRPRRAPWPEVRTPIGRVLPGLRDPDCHELRCHCSDPAPAGGTTRSARAHPWGGNARSPDPGHGSHDLIWSDPRGRARLGRRSPGRVNGRRAEEVGW